MKQIHLSLIPFLKPGHFFVRLCKTFLFGSRSSSFFLFFLVFLLCFFCAPKATVPRVTGQCSCAGSANCVLLHSVYFRGSCRVQTRNCGETHASRCVTTQIEDNSFISCQLWGKGTHRAFSPTDFTYTRTRVRTILLPDLPRSCRTSAVANSQIRNNKI